MKLRGVNLGGWLVIERWITPNLFKNFQAQDEYSFCLELKDQKEKILKSHWKSFITDTDFEWISKVRLNSVRIPIGHWIFGNVEPYVGSIEILDWAVNTAAKYNLKVLIDLHGAPGSQNGWDHSGKAGNIGWDKDPDNITMSVSIIAKLADRYKDFDNVVAIELLNEPFPGISKKKLLNYYDLAYKEIRKYKRDETAVVISDGFRPQKWKKEMTDKEYNNVWFDTHLYQCFDQKDKKLSLESHLKKTSNEWMELIRDIQKIRPIIVGEWSLGLDPSTFRGMDEPEKKSSVKLYANAQIEVFNEAQGWFFWTYKMDDLGGWNFRHCVQSGILPGSIA